MSNLLPVEFFTFLRTAADLGERGKPLLAARVLETAAQLLVDLAPDGAPYAGQYGPPHQRLADAVENVARCITSGQREHEREEPDDTSKGTADAAYTTKPEPPNAAKAPEPTKVPAPRERQPGEEG